VSPRLRKQIAAFRPGSGTGTAFLLSSGDVQHIKREIIQANGTMAKRLNTEFEIDGFARSINSWDDNDEYFGSDPDDDKPPKRKKQIVVRSIRESDLTKKLRSLYRGACQLCGKCYAVRGKSIAEGHHVRPLSKKHKGPDNLSNMLLLCPTHHAMFDRGGFFIKFRSKTVFDWEGKALRRPLFVARQHTLRNRHIAYHNNHIFAGVKRPG
jgi:hypothetical protein